MALPPSMHGLSLDTIRVFGRFLRQSGRSTKTCPEVSTEAALPQGPRRSRRILQFRHLDQESSRALPREDGQPWGTGIAGRAHRSLYGMVEASWSPWKETRVWCEDVRFDGDRIGERPPGIRGSINHRALPHDRTALAPGSNPFRLSRPTVGWRRFRSY